MNKDKRKYLRKKKAENTSLLMELQEKFCLDLGLSEKEIYLSNMKFRCRIVDILLEKSDELKALIERKYREKLAARILDQV